MQKNIRKLDLEDMDEASRIIFKVFYEFVAPGYSMEGIENFRNLIDPISLKINTYDDHIIIYGYFIDKTPIGYIASRGTNHICMFFVRKEFQGQGIGRSLFEHFLKFCDKSAPITVNSSDYAVPIYKSLGFTYNGARIVENGLISNPMIKSPK